jgi:hypothetical protein
MVRTVSWLLLLGWIFCPSVVWGQDDAPWWRQLFGQSDHLEEVQDMKVMEKEELPTLEQKGPNRGTSDGDSEGLSGSEGGAFDVEVPLGSVSWSIPDAIVALDSMRPDEERVVIPGFRIQLFMGRLDSARALRHQLMETDPLKLAVHLAPYPPLFGVQVGDFRTPLSAHRAMGELRRLYPDALVVPAELSVEEAFPSSSDCIRTP